MSTRDDVQTLGTITDAYGKRVKVGTDHVSVTIGDYTFPRSQRLELTELLQEAGIDADTHECGDCT